jgi:hypothetical protein
MSSQNSTGTTLSLRQEKWCLCCRDLASCAICALCRFPVRCAKEAQPVDVSGETSRDTETSEDLSDNEIGTDGLDKLFQAGPVTAKFQTTSCTRKRIGLHWQLQVLRDHRVPCVVLKAYRNSVDEALLQSTMSCCVSNFGNQLCQQITNHDESFQERSGPLISYLRIFMAYLKVLLFFHSFGSSMICQVP